MDAQLVELVRAVNAGAPCPPIRVLTASGIYMGTPKPSEQFWERSVSPLSVEMGNTRGGGLLRRKEAANPAETEALSAALARLSGSGDSNDPTAVALANVQWFPPQGDGLEIPTLRVPISAVTGWWVAGGKLVKSGSSWFVGAIIPAGA